MSSENEKTDSAIKGTANERKGNGALPEGTVLRGRYQLEKVLGRGGFGITYRAMDMNVQVDVAVKEYLAESEEDRERAVREARIAASLYDLDGIVAVRDYFVEHDIAYIVMEYVHGISVKQYIAQHGRMSGPEVLEGMKPLLLSVQRIHEKGILHRDISADNLMITSEGKLKLIDFGAASHLDPDRKEHTVLIKRGFVPVEQYRAEEKLGPWTDVYSLCATMYFMITGMVPEDAMERWISDRLTDLREIYGTGLTMEQSQAVMKGLAVKKEDRYENLAALCGALYGEKDSVAAKLWFRTEELPHQILSGHTQTLRKEAVEALHGKDRTKKAWIASALTLIVVLALAAGLWFALGKGKIRGGKSGGYQSPVPAATQEAVADTEAPSDPPAATTGTTDVEKTAEPAKESAKNGKSSSGQGTSKTAGKKKKQGTSGSSGKTASKTKNTSQNNAGRPAAAVTPANKTVETAKPAKTPAPHGKSQKKQEFEGNLDELLQ